jgi:hypothetical protein
MKDKVCDKVIWEKRQIVKAACLLCGRQAAYCFTPRFSTQLAGGRTAAEQWREG